MVENIRIWGSCSIDSVAVDLSAFSGSDNSLKRLTIGIEGTVACIAAF